MAKIKKCELDGDCKIEGWRTFKEIAEIMSKEDPALNKDMCWRIFQKALQKVAVDLAAAETGMKLTRAESYRASRNLPFQIMVRQMMLEE